MLTKQQLVPVLSLAVTLTVAHGLKLQLTNQFALENFNRDWMVGSLGLMIGVIVNDMATSKLLAKIKSTGKVTEQGMAYIGDILNTLVLLATQNVVISLANGTGIEFSPSWIRGTFLVIAGVLVYDILIDPFVPESKYKGSIVNVLKKTSAIAASDYMSDLDFDNFPLEAGTTAAGIVIGDLSTTPIADALN